jgi:hypothetical protein
MLCDRRGHCVKLSEQMENLDNNNRAILLYEKTRIYAFQPNPTRQNF